MATYSKVCKICGKSFRTSVANTSICSEPHYRPCPICGKPVEVKRGREYESPRTCSIECRRKLRESSMIEKYGVTTPLLNSEIHNKGTSAAQSKSAISKRRSTCVEKYGADNPMKSSEVAQKSAENRKTNNPDVDEKIRDIFLAKYGVDNPMKVPEFVDKIAQTMLERYGVKSPAHVPEFKDKMIETCLDRYGVPFALLKLEVVNQHISKINHNFGTKLVEEGFRVEYEHRIGTKSYDIYLPALKTVIEIDPTYTHNSVGNHWDKNGTPKDYHLNKTRLAESQGLRCIHIFDWEDENKVILSLKSTVSIGARQCKIIGLEPVDKFLNTYHLQNTCKGQTIWLGLMYQDELVQVMTFGKPRYSSKYEYELLRLCTRAPYRVIGGASRLFKYFINTYNPQSIISYCDYSKFSGKVYKEIGMTLDHTSEPQKIWSKGRRKVTSNLLRARGYDQLFGTNYGKGTCNEELMIENGWLPVYDCGQKVFTWASNSQKFKDTYK